MSDISVCAPKAWKAVPLADLASFRTGPFGSTFHKSDYHQGGVPLINPSHIIDGKIVPDELVAIAPDLASRLSVFALRENDIVIGRRGEMGRCAVVRKHQEGFLCGTGSMIVRPRPGVSPELLQAFLASPRVIAKIEENSVGTTMINLNQGTLSSLEILLPDDEQGQKAIAAALSDADGVVAGLERVIAKKRLIKQGAMQDLLTPRRRLPGFSGEWIETTFGQCFQFLRTGSASRAQLGANLGIGYIHYGDIHGMKSVVLDLSRTSLPEIMPKQVATLSRVQDGDLVIADASEDIIDVGKSVEVRGVGSAEVVAGLHTFLLRGNPEVVADGFKGYIQFLRDVRAGIESIATGSSVYGISKKNLAGLKFRVPPVKEQAAIGELFRDMDAEIQTLESRLAKARAVKEGMMQNLLTGRVRLV